MMPRIQTRVIVWAGSLMLIGVAVAFSNVSQTMLLKQEAHKQDNGFRLALPGYTYQFPRDHASHPDFKTEWWYYTGHLQAVDPASTNQHTDNSSSPTRRLRRLGYEVTFFRVGQRPPNKATQPQAKQTDNFWNTDTYYMAHFAITDETGKRFLHTQRFNRNTPYRAGSKTDQYKVWNEHWLGERTESGVHHIKASHGGNTPEGFSLDFILKEGKGPIVHGRNGVSQKADCRGCASHYYSLTRMPTTGTARLGTTTYQVTGTSWMDHEFGSNQLQANQTGWDWFSLQLSDGHELMLYQMRLDNQAVDPNSSGTWVSPQGRATHRDLSDISIQPLGQWTSPHTGGVYPSGWRVVDNTEHLDVTITPVLTDQELVPELPEYGVAYWEGRCTVRGTHAGKRITGNAYVELTGYDKPFTQQL